MRWLRNIGIAFGSLVAAGLLLGFVRFGASILIGALIAFALVFGPVAAALTFALQPGQIGSVLATVVLGGLIYRDIVRRDPARSGRSSGT